MKVYYWPQMNALGFKEGKYFFINHDVEEYTYLSDAFFFSSIKDELICLGNI
jgi:hypothetical protein